MIKTLMIKLQMPGNLEILIVKTNWLWSKRPNVQTKLFSSRRRNHWGSRARTASHRTAWSTRAPPRRGRWRGRWRGWVRSAGPAVEVATAVWAATDIPMVARSTTRVRDTQTCCLETRRSSWLGNICKSRKQLTSSQVIAPLYGGEAELPDRTN